MPTHMAGKFSILTLSQNRPRINIKIFCRAGPLIHLFDQIILDTQLNDLLLLGFNPIDMHFFIL